MAAMKTAAVSSITVALLCCVFASAGSEKVCDHYAPTAGNFTVPLQYKLKDNQQLRWKHDNNVIFNRKPGKLFIGDPKDVTPDGSLQLMGLDGSKEGIYMPEVYEDGKSITTNNKGVRLCVLDRVQKPLVKIQCITSSSVKFICENSENVNFEWSKNGKVLEKSKEKTLFYKAAKEVETDTFICKTSNKISFDVSAPVTQKCVKSGFAFPETLFGINIWIIVGGGGGVVVLLILFIIICCIRQKKRKRVQLKDEEELRLDWTNPNQHRQHNHPPNQHNHPPNQHNHPPNQHNHPPNQHNHPPNQHQHQQQHPAGHTGPRQHRSKQQRPREPQHPSGQPLPNPRRAAQGSMPVTNDDEQPPPLPQPRKKAPKTARV